MYHILKSGKYRQPYLCVVLFSLSILVSWDIFLILWTIKLVCSVHFRDFVNNNPTMRCLFRQCWCKLPMVIELNRLHTCNNSNLLSGIIAPFIFAQFCSRIYCENVVSVMFSIYLVKFHLKSLQVNDRTLNILQNLYRVYWS